MSWKNIRYTQCQVQSWSDMGDGSGIGLELNRVWKYLNNYIFWEKVHSSSAWRNRQLAWFFRASAKIPREHISPRHVDHSDLRRPQFVFQKAACRQRRSQQPIYYRCRVHPDPEDIPGYFAGPVHRMGLHAPSTNSKVRKGSIHSLHWWCALGWCLDCLCNPWDEKTGATFWHAQHPKAGVGRNGGLAEEATGPVTKPQILARLVPSLKLTTEEKS